MTKLSFIGPGHQIRVSDKEILRLMNCRGWSRLKLAFWVIGQLKKTVYLLTKRDPVRVDYF